MNRPTTLDDYDILEEVYADMMHLAGTITSVLNCMSNDTERGYLAFSVAMEREHRTLQQTRSEIQRFVGSLEGHRASKGVFITTSTFSKEAREYVRTIGKRIRLIDGNELAQLMVDYGVAVSEIHNYSLKRVDSDYFAEEPI